MVPWRVTVVSDTTENQTRHFNSITHGWHLWPLSTMASSPCCSVLCGPFGVERAFLLLPGGLAADDPQLIPALGRVLAVESHLILQGQSPSRGAPPGRTTLQVHPISRAVSGSAEISVAFLFLHLPNPAPVIAPRLLIPPCSPMNFLHAALYLGLLPGGAEPKTWAVFKMVSPNQDPANNGKAYAWCQGLTAGMKIHISMRPGATAVSEAVKKQPGILQASRGDFLRKWTMALLSFCLPSLFSAVLFWVSPLLFVFIIQLHVPAQWGINGDICLSYLVCGKVSEHMMKQVSLWIVMKTGVSH